MTTNKKETELSEVACYDTKTFQGQLCKRLQAVAEAHAGIGDGQELVKKLTQEVYNAISGKRERRCCKNCVNGRIIH